MFHHGDIGGVKDAFELIAVIKPLGQPHDMKIAVRGCAYNQLGTLSSGGEPGRVAVLHQFLPALLITALDLPHRVQDGPFCLIRGQGVQTGFRRQFDIDAEPVRQKSELFHQFRGRAWDGLCVDIAVEAPALPEKPQCLNHQLHGIVRTAEDAGGKEQSFDIIPPVEIDGQIRQFLGSKGCSRGIVGPAVDAVFAVIDAAIRQKYFQEGDAASVGGEGVAASRGGSGGISDHACAGGPVSSA